jgi:small ligand-binding sensory domain FIST
MPSLAASTLFEGPFQAEAVRQAAETLRTQAGGKASLAFAFVTPDYLPFLEEFIETVRLHGHVPEVVGCTAGGLVGTGLELEDKPGFSLLFLHLPKTKLHLVPLSQAEVETAGDASFWPAQTGVSPDDVDGWILLANPFKFAVDLWLQQWNRAYPEVPCVGGLASGSSDEQAVAVFHNHTENRFHALAIGLSGGVALRPVVSQGCRPIGEPMTITRAEDNVVHTLGATPAYQVLDEAFGTLTEEERATARGNLFIGLATSEYVDEFKQGDFLIRQIIGADPQSGAVVVRARPRVGQTLQYQLRDQTSADRELHRLLQQSAKRKRVPFAALMFTCNGRGRELFKEEHHDAAALAREIAPVPTAGFFCFGEIGPVGSGNFLHGYTASIALLVDRG